MKKTLFLVLLFAVSVKAYSQTAALTVDNANGCGCDYQIVIHAKCGVFSSGCGTSVAATIYVPAGHVHSWSSPNQLETSTTYCSAFTPCTTLVGWTSLPSPYTSVSNYGPGGWGAYPALNWIWTYATVDYPGCSSGVAGDLGPYCIGTTPLSGSCGSSAVWTETTTSDFDVTINIY